MGDEKEKKNHLDLRPSDEMLAAIDDFRVQRRPVLSRSAAARMLVVAALDIAAGAEKETTDD